MAKTDITELEKAIPDTAVEQACRLAWSENEQKSISKAPIMDFLKPKEQIKVNRDIERFVATFKESISLKSEPSAGEVTIKFAKAVLSIIGSDYSLNDLQKKAVIKLCDAMIERPLPALLWADFVRQRLDAPDTVARILTCCVINHSTLEQRMKNTMAKNYKAFNLQSGKPLLVLGFSKAIAGALEGIPKKILERLIIMTPRHVRPGIEINDGLLLKKKIKYNLPNVRVRDIENELALESIKRGEVSFVMMGARVIGLRSNGELEIVNAQSGRLYADTASSAQIPVAVIAGSYKFWPTITYEKYRPTTIVGHYDDIVPGHLIKLILTEDGVYRTEEFRKEYLRYFEANGVPAASIRYCFDTGTESLTYLNSKISKVLVDLGGESSGLRKSNVRNKQISVLNKAAKKTKHEASLDLKHGIRDFIIVLNTKNHEIIKLFRSPYTYRVDKKSLYTAERHKLAKLTASYPLPDYDIYIDQGDLSELKATYPLIREWDDVKIEEIKV